MLRAMRAAFLGLVANGALLAPAPGLAADAPNPDEAPAVPASEPERKAISQPWATLGGVVLGEAVGLGAGAAISFAFSDEFTFFFAGAPFGATIGGAVGGHLAAEPNRRLPVVAAVVGTAVSGYALVFITGPRSDTAWQTSYASIFVAPPLAATAVAALPRKADGRPRLRVVPTGRGILVGGAF